VDAFQIVNVVGMSVNIVGSYGLNGDPTRPVQMNTSQLIWMAGQTNRPSNDVMITKRLLEDTTGLVGVINSIAGECTAVEHEWNVCNRKNTAEANRCCDIAQVLLFCTQLVC